MKTIIKIIILGITLGGFLFPSSSLASEIKRGIDYAENHLSAHVFRGKLGEVLLAVTEKAKIKFLLNEAIAKEEVSISFERLPLQEGVKKILHQFSYAMIFDSSGQLKSVFVWKKGSTSSEGPVSARYRSAQSAPKGPKGASPPGPIDSSEGPAGLDESLPESAPIEGTQGDIQQLNHDDINLSPAPTDDDKSAEATVPNQPAGERTATPVVEGPSTSDRDP